MQVPAPVSVLFMVKRTTTVSRSIGIPTASQVPSTSALDRFAGAAATGGAAAGLSAAGVSGLLHAASARTAAATASERRMESSDNSESVTNGLAVNVVRPDAARKCMAGLLAGRIFQAEAP